MPNTGGMGGMGNIKVAAFPGVADSRPAKRRRGPARPASGARAGPDSCLIHMGLSPRRHRPAPGWARGGCLGRAAAPSTGAGRARRGACHPRGGCLAAPRRHRPAPGGARGGCLGRAAQMRVISTAWGEGQSNGATVSLSNLGYTVVSQAHFTYHFVNKLIFFGHIHKSLLRLPFVPSFCLPLFG